MRDAVGDVLASEWFLHQNQFHRIGRSSSLLLAWSQGLCCGVCSCAQMCTSAGCSEGSRGCPSPGAVWCSHSHAGAALCLPVLFLNTRTWLWSTKLKGRFKAVKEGDSLKRQCHIENSSVSPPVLKWLPLLCCEGSGCFLPSFQVGQFTVVQLF